MFSKPAPATNGHKCYLMLLPRPALAVSDRPGRLTASQCRQGSGLHQASIPWTSDSAGGAHFRLHAARGNSLRTRARTRRALATAFRASIRDTSGYVG